MEILQKQLQKSNYKKWIKQFNIQVVNIKTYSVGTV